MRRPWKWRVRLILGLVLLASSPFACREVYVIGMEKMRVFYMRRIQENGTVALDDGSLVVAQRIVLGAIAAGLLTFSTGMVMVVGAIARSNPVASAESPLDSSELN